MNIFEIILWPIRWIIELLLTVFHSGLSVVGFSANDGVTWILAIAGVLIVTRLIALPLMVSSVKSARKMTAIAPKLKAIQEKYKGKNDAESRAAMSMENLELYREANVNPLGAIFPLLVQLPVFFALYFVLRTAQQAHAGIGLLNASLASSFSNATAFGAPLKYALTSPHHSGNLLIVGIALLAVVAVAQYLTQLASLKLNTVKMTGNQRIGAFIQNGLLYFAPVIFVVTSLVIPLGLLFYFAISSIWGLIQQLFIIRLLPMADTPAYAAMEARRAKKAARKS